MDASFDYVRRVVPATETLIDNPFWANGANIAADFTKSTYYGMTASQVSCLRGGAIAYASDNSGNWSSFSNNVSRITNQGLLIEEQRTNSISNNSMQGAAAGSPGTLPTFWSIPQANGLTTNVIAIGTQNGIDYIDLQITGNTTGVFYVICFTPQGTSGTAANPNDVWSESFFASLVGGDLTNVTSINVDVRWYTAAGAGNGTNDTVFSPTPTLTRYQGSGTAPASTAFTAPGLSVFFNNGVAINFTIRIGWPQLELGSFVTSPIRTTNATATRASDIITVLSAPPVDIIGSAFGSHIPIVSASGVNRFIYDFSDGSNQNSQHIYVNATPGYNFDEIKGGASVGGVFNSAAVPANILSRVAHAYGPNDTVMFANGSAVGISALGVTPPTNILRLGSNFNSAFVMNGTMQKFAFWNGTRLTNAQLQNLSATA